MRWLFSRFRHLPDAPSVSDASVLLTNTLTNNKDTFSPQKAGMVTLYSCGPTVYSQAHIGNLRAYVFSDMLARMLGEAGYHVRRVINITDVGHLQGDGDMGEDKMEAGARAAGLRAADIAARYTRLFLEDIQTLGVATQSIDFPRATEYIEEQINIIQRIDAAGYTYRTTDGIYFDTAAFPGYGALDHGGAKLREEALAGIGRRIAENTEKRHPADFALWKFSPPGVRRQQEWKSPWGIGFPGWHLECSAMVRALLGQPIDIHTGGIDHIPVHHTNEIAQSEAAFGKPLARYWMHSAFLTIDGRKVSKSDGDDIYLSDLTDRGLHPRSLRYLFLQAHYRAPLSFSWEAVTAADAARSRLARLAQTIREEARGRSRASDAQRRMIAHLRDDLAVPQALALLWEVVKDEDMSREEQLGVILAAEAVFALDLFAHDAPHTETIPAEVLALVQKREQARAARDFATADSLRIHIENRGYHVEDRPDGPVVTPRHD